MQKKRPSLRDIAKLAEELEDIEKKTFSTERIWKKKIKKNINFKNLNDKEKLQLNKHLAQLTNLKNKLLLKQNVNEAIISLSNYLIRLKTINITGDYASAAILLKKFTTQEDLSINFLIKELDDFQSTLNSLETTYTNLSEFLFKTKPSLELKLDHKDHAFDQRIQIFQDISQKQKQLVGHIGSHFLDISRNLIKDPLCQRYIQKEMS